MTIKFKNMLIASLLIVTSTGFTQTMEDLELLGIDSSQLALLEQIQPENVDETNSTEDMIAIKESESIRKDQEEINIEDDSFGYSGRDDFFVSSQIKTTEEPLKRFGYDYFINRPSTFAPLSDIPIPPDYIIGPGDVIKIILYGNSNKNYSLRVTRDGDIYLPELGPISIAGLTFIDLKETIKEIISSQLIGTQVTLTLGELRSINIFILGEADQPGMYTVSSLTTMTNAIFASGGIKTSGSLRNIELKRNGKIVSKFDFYDLLLNGDTSNDVKLMSGDILFIPPLTKTVAITGNVQRPGIYELLESETAEDLLNYAGKVKAGSNLKSTEIKRISADDNGYNLFSVDLSQGKTSALALKDGDTLSIFPIQERLNNAILVRGYFPQTGFYPWIEGMEFKDLVGSEQDLLPMTDLQYALIQRKGNESNSYSFIHINLDELLNNPDSKNNIDLRKQDEIFFFPNQIACSFIEEQAGEGGIVLSVKELQNIENEADKENITDTKRLECRQEILKPAIKLANELASDLSLKPIVRILGNVSFPGEYPLTEEATLREIIAASGTLNEATFLSEVEIIRSSLQEKEINQDRITGKYSEIIDTPIQPRDIISIKKVPLKYQTVRIEGEVFFPGDYAIQQDETLLEVIQRAGGFNKTARPDNLILTRVSVAEQQKINLDKSKAEIEKQLTLLQTQNPTGDNNSLEYLSRLNSFISDDTDNADTENLILGRIVFNFDDILLGQARDIIVSDGDRIIVPKDSQTVTVIGEVYAPSTHFIQERNSFADYIDASGGVNKFGDLNAAYIIKGDGTVVPVSTVNSGGFFRGKDNQLEGGDTIVVPIEIRTYTGVKLANEVTQVIYQLAVATAAVNSF